jgi:[ribosomal protein S18]-alanine N-acetyltransferase
MSEHTPLPVGAPFAPVIAALQNACFPDDPWSAGSIAGMMGTPGVFALLTEHDGVPTGFILMRAAAEDGEVLALGVDPALRRSGLGSRLLAAGIAEAGTRGATAVFLEVAEDNGAARALYHAHGLVQIGRRPSYYRRGDGRVAALVLRFPPPGNA